VLGGTNFDWFIQLNETIKVRTVFFFFFLITLEAGLKKALEPQVALES